MLWRSKIVRNMKQDDMRNMYMDLNPEKVWERLIERYTNIRILISLKLTVDCSKLKVGQVHFPN